MSNSSQTRTILSKDGYECILDLSKATVSKQNMYVYPDKNNVVIGTWNYYSLFVASRLRDSIFEIRCEMQNNSYTYYVYWRRIHPFLINVCFLGWSYKEAMMQFDLFLEQFEPEEKQ